MSVIVCLYITYMYNDIIYQIPCTALSCGMLSFTIAIAPHQEHDISLAVLITDLDAAWVERLSKVSPSCEKVVSVGLVRSIAQTLLF